MATDQPATESLTSEVTHVSGYVPEPLWDAVEYDTMIAEERRNVPVGVYMPQPPPSATPPCLVEYGLTPPFAGIGVPDGTDLACCDEPALTAHDRLGRTVGSGGVTRARRAPVDQTHGLGPVRWNWRWPRRDCASCEHTQRHLQTPAQRPSATRRIPRQIQPQTTATTRPFTSRGRLSTRGHDQPHVVVHHSTSAEYVTRGHKTRNKLKQYIA